MYARFNVDDQVIHVPTDTIWTIVEVNKRPSTQSKSPQFFKFQSDPSIHIRNLQFDGTYLCEQQTLKGTSRKDFPENELELHKQKQ